MTWKYAIAARREQSWRRRGLPLTYVKNPETGEYELPRIKLKQLTGPGLARGSGTGRHVRYRDIRAIRRCVAVLVRTRGLGSLRDIDYKAHTRKRRDGRIVDVSRRNDYRNMRAAVKRWWPLCFAAYLKGNQDLL